MANQFSNPLRKCCAQELESAIAFEQELEQGANKRITRTPETSTTCTTPSAAKSAPRKKLRKEEVAPVALQFDRLEYRDAQATSKESDSTWDHDAQPVGPIYDDDDVPPTQPDALVDEEGECSDEVLACDLAKAKGCL